MGVQGVQNPVLEIIDLLGPFFLYCSFISLNPLKMENPSLQVEQVVLISCVSVSV